jgi:hypothetical protein
VGGTDDELCVRAEGAKANAAMQRGDVDGIMPLFFT